ncbi:hypothetical protein [Kitasatospora sp. NPDC087314]|uniref:hypothetical protein n=1 Tax=Kitasatospora sp. NPDC087314 TaxID=3364068 RepID=UPI0037FDD919
MTTIQRRAAERLYAGSAEVARRLGRWAAGTSVGVKIGGGALLWKGAPVLLDAAHHQPLIPVGTAAAWTWAAWRAGHPAPLPEPGKEAAQKPGAEPSATQATQDQEPNEQDEFLALLYHLMPGTTPGRDDRIHLVQIADAWSDNPTDTSPIRALLSDTGIPITDCRVPGRGPSKGIYRRDLPPLPNPDHQTLSGVVAEPDQQQQQQQQPVEAPREGFLIKADPANPAHSIVHWKEAS